MRSVTVLAPAKLNLTLDVTAVSYTHLDVYKRQALPFRLCCLFRIPPWRASCMLFVSKCAQVRAFIAYYIPKVGFL